MTEKNGHGLSRNIPAGVKRTIRQECGFGCVVCGSAMIQYEHIDPPFAWAKEHDPSRMALLCPTCHDKVTRKFLPKQAVSDAREDPLCRRQGFSSELFELGKTSPQIVIGGLTLEECPVPIQIRGTDLIRISAPEEQGGPVRLSGCFQDTAGAVSLTIEDNEWSPFTTNWDVEFVGGILTIRDAPQHISLRLRFALPHSLVVEGLDMLLHGHRIVASPTVLDIWMPNGV